MSIPRAWLPTHPPTSNARMQCRCSSRRRKNHFGTADLRWPARVGQQKNRAQDGRARLAGRARRGGNPICPRRAFLACLALHAPRPVALADFFSILLENLLLPPPTVNRFRQALVRPILLTTTQTSEKKLYIPSH